MTDLVFFTCDCVSWRLDVFQAELTKVVEAVTRADAEARIVLAYRTRDDSALLVLSSQQVPAVLLADLVAGHVSLPGLRRLPVDATSVSPRSFLRHRISTCDVALRVTDVKPPIDAIRSILGMETDRRLARRMPVTLPLSLHTGDAVVEGSTSDVSAGGMFVRSELKPRLGTQLRVDFFPRSEKPLSAALTVVRQTDDGFGAKLELSFEAQGELYRRLRTLRAPLPVAEPQFVQKWRSDDDLLHILGQVAQEATPGPGRLQKVFGDAFRQSPAVMPLVGAVPAPREPALEEPVAASIEEALEAPTSRILLALGFEAMRRHLARHLRRHHCEAIEVRTSEEAFQTLLDEVLGLDLLVLDATLPGMSSKDLIFRIRELGGETDLPIVLFTDGAEELRQHALLQEGVTQVFSLSLPTETLAASLVTLVEDHRRAAIT
jgi:CheY-like chemotaxis protein